jgi:NAD(P)H-dependent FMN reductase
MLNIVIISASVRTGRKSNRVALFFKNYLETNNALKSEILDLASYNFPVFDERLKNQKSPSVEAIQFAEKIKESDGVLIVTPEYNGGYPASLKNVIDLLYEEWYKKPIAIATASSGIFGGTQVITSLQFTLWKIRALTVPATFPVTKVQESFDENGNPKEKEATEKRAATFIKEFLWIIEANKKMNS